MSTDRDRILALAHCLECDVSSLVADEDDETRIGNGHAEYRVLTEQESETAMRDKVKEMNDAKDASNYRALAEGLDEDPEDDQMRLSPEFVRDVLGYGYILSSHDCEECQEMVNGVPYFIYRID